MNGNLSPTILRNLLVAVLFSVFGNSVFGSADGITEASGYQQADSQGQQTTAPAPDSVKASQDAQKAAEEAKSAKSGAVSAAADAKSAAPSTDKAKADAADAVQKADSVAGAGLAAAETAKKKALQADAAAGVALNGSTNVKDNVTAQVVLLPRKQAEKVFSKEIGRRYAVVQVTINNQSKDAAFLLHSIFVDYSQWLLSGMSPSPQGTCRQTQTTSQALSCPGQVASVESRVIRGELQDAATWTWRNGITRAAVLVGTMASGIPAFSSKNALKYVGAYNGEFIPGVEVFWPDGTVPQLNRVSDLGFQSNTVIGKETAGIVYAFFPIDRFLTPGMRSIFLNAPAVFFAPAQIFVDRHIGKRCWKPGICLSQSDVDKMKNLIEGLAAKACKANNKDLCPQSGDSQDQRDQKMLALLTMDCTKDEAKDVRPECQVALPVQRLIQGISLNSINVLVQGAMTVDVTTVPASITDIAFDKGNDSSAVWEETANSLDATITGRFLTGGIPSVKSIDPPAGSSDKIADYIDPKTISVVPDESNDTRLRFKLQWKKAIPNESKLHFQVTKHDPKDTKKTSGVNSMEFILPVNYVPKGKPSGDKPSMSAVSVDNGEVAATWKAGSTLTGNITGSALDGATPDVVTMLLPDRTSATISQYIETVKLDTSKTNDGSNLHFTLKLKKDVLKDSKLTFKVTKNVAPGADKGQAVESNPKDYAVNYK